MRKYIKQQLYGILNTLDEAIDALKVYIDSGKTEEIMTLLQDMQDVAVQVGESIEETEGEGTKAVTLLEQFCDELWQISQCVNEEISVAQNKGVDKLQTLVTLLAMVHKQIQGFKETTEVVFLPYNASMWDSLESVWMKARDDENVEAYVIPIPYYDKNPDGSFGEFHYEGNQYPKYVPITDFNQYDFENRHPDKIYIHNPYDEYNLVTSVHPYFYASKLKNLTDELIYIPYFVLAEIDPDNKAAVKGIEHFITVPGVVHANKVIVQSEKMRQIYVNVLTEAFAGTAFDREHWEKVIDGSGSPKMDKVERTKREDIDIPEAWLHIIQKEDGSFKKIVFYNTSVVALINEKEKILRKMKDVLRIFYENREKVVLLWRPHPLIKATLESMHPELWEEYSKIVEEYKNAGWGIYDDTTDMNRAIVLSDAYYGDGSSIVQLYQKTKKPVMIQSCDVIQE